MVVNCGDDFLHLDPSLGSPYSQGSLETVVLIVSGHWSFVVHVYADVKLNKIAKSFMRIWNRIMKEL